MRKLILLLTLWFAYDLALAQEGTEESKELEKITQEFATAYANFYKTKDAESILKYMDPKLTSLLINTSIRDKVSYMRSDYNGFVSYLRSLQQTPETRINYDIAKVIHSYVSGNSGVVVYVVNFENVREGEIWVKGQETVSMQYRKIDGKWKIIHYTIMGFEDEKYKGVCLCELFASTANFVAKMTIPQGKGYNTETNQLTFTIVDSQQAILYGDLVFYWDANGDVWSTDKDGKKNKKLGNAAQRPEAVVVVIKDHYAEPCESFKIKF